MALHLHSLGGGTHEVSTEDWQRVLGVGPRGYPKRETISTHAKELVFAGWAIITPGGRGSPRYSLQHPQGAAESLQHPQGAVNEKSTAPPGCSKDRLQHPQGAAEAPPPPPYTSPSSSVDARAREAMDREPDLRGLRGALADYLKLGRVENHHAYVMTVLGWIQGTDPSAWFDPRSNRTLTEDRQAIIAGCLNELANCDEVGTYFPGAPGDVVNLRAKIRYKVRSILGAKRDAERNTATGTDGARPRGRRDIDISNQGSLD